MADTLTLLEQNILKAKGMTPAQIAALAEVGIGSKKDFATVGDAATLRALTGLDEAVAQAVMQWASGAPAPAQSGASAAGLPASVVVDSGDIVYCAHCKTRQPKDYKAGDLCLACGRQAEPTLACYWCGASGPGAFCRQCGAQHVPSGELELALQLRRDGLAKDDVPARLAALSPADKEALFARARRGMTGYARGL